MWIAAPWGFLMPAARPAKYIPANDDRTMQVRARRAKDLDLLRAMYMQGTLGTTIYTPKMDYEYRAYCCPDDFAEAMSAMVRDIDYVKFKPETLWRFEDHQLHSMYNAMWSTIMHHLSTKSHRDEYWDTQTKKYTSGKSSGGKASSGTAKGATGGTYAGGTVPKKGASTGTGFPAAGPSGSVSPRHSLDAVDRLSDDETAGLQRWFADAELNNPSKHRNTAADRDEYLPEIDGWDPGDGPYSTYPSGIKAVDELYAEIDKIFDELKAVEFDHSACVHSSSRHGKNKCNNKRKRVASQKVDALRVEIDRAYADAAADAAFEERASWAAEAEAVEGVIDGIVTATVQRSVATAADIDQWKGYPWERKELATVAAPPPGGEAAPN